MPRKGPRILQIGPHWEPLTAEFHARVHMVTAYLHSSLTLRGWVLDDCHLVLLLPLLRSAGYFVLLVCGWLLLLHLLLKHKSSAIKTIYNHIPKLHPSVRLYSSIEDSTHTQSLCVFVCMDECVWLYVWVCVCVYESVVTVFH